MFSVRIPKKLYEKMKRFKEINWSEVVRKAIEEYIEKLEETRLKETSTELLRKLGLSPSELEVLEEPREWDYYRRMVEEEWKRTKFTTQAQ